MAFCFGRQFRRIAAEALTADRDEMRVLIERILPPRDDGTPPVLHLKSEADRQQAPAVIVAAFFADALTGDEAADLLRQTEDPAFRKQPLQNPLDDYPPWGPPISHLGDMRREVGALVNNKENTSALADRSAADGIREHPPP